jgi:pimeloyl-ACP methyl ester carboxylesterase
MRRKTPVVMIHGAFCGGWAFEKFRRPFEESGFDVYTPTLRHHDGEGSAAVASTGLGDYASDVERILSGLSELPVIVGHSLGGLLAQMIAARRQVRAIVLIAPCAPWGVMPTTIFEVASAQALFLAGDYWNRALRPDYGVASAHALDKLSPAERKSVFDRFVSESGLATFEILHWTLDFRRASYVRARNVVCPVLCLAGGDDRINPPSTVRRIAERYDGRAVFEELDGHSHWLIGEPGWEKIAERMIAWFDRILSEPTAVRAG